jgi:chloramphenicol 3-O phosphotransferase
VLNGASSSGKTTLAVALRDLLGAHAVALSIDDLYGSVHAARSNDWSLFRALTRVLFDSAASFAREGFDVIVDTVFERVECREILLDAVGSLPTYLVGLECPVDVLTERERMRQNRRVGLAADQAARVHDGHHYDLVLDTSVTSAADCAHAIARLLSARVDATTGPRDE